ncbi:MULTISPECIES: acyl-CoA thioesterase [unclassified Rhizobium]|uniref:acyl-CoA thioesterase n=1 Tax=unclassified Rhizobium TaxID=2613769 RepID=UPI001ADD3F38|nr:MULTISPECIES: thioesterase family protein [unclassified Rhizobium]MBO9097491.1 acyl-CoA thioesterase [Rhizobium sp. L58/93]MBO9133657.1 acyl-CoA thioesterase [Rhizobium sp. B209b/85]MBO9167730.1 acyl-CoA thioesterase [Rhizobium sp. L245/93]MBO9183689.1 acyl-CoA thioesterase [Rhizobium sp. E27B/91]QXZ84006.1 acyl-CoA thioesterase [Rhizobium sp. K1/93]
MSRAQRADITEMRVPPRDVDRFGQMFIASYISEAETALSNFWRERPEVRDEPIYIPTRASCSLHRGLRYDEFARFSVTVNKIGGKSVGFLVMVEAGNELAAEVEILWLAVRGEEHEPSPLPEDTRDWLYKYLD